MFYSTYASLPGRNGVYKIIEATDRAEAAFLACCWWKDSMPLVTPDRYNPNRFYVSDGRLTMKVTVHEERAPL